MSGGTPGGGGYMRQRHSQGYGSSGDDLEDDACSRPMPSFAPMPRVRTWSEVLENVLWIASAAFIIYFGDQHSNLVYILWHDDRIRRIPFYLGMGGVVLNIVILFYMSVLARNIKWGQILEFLNPSALPVVTLLGLASFGLFALSLWPIWGFLTIPLLFTLFMALTVIAPYMMMETFRPVTDSVRTD